MASSRPLLNNRGGTASYGDLRAQKKRTMTAVWHIQRRCFALNLIQGAEPGSPVPLRELWTSRSTPSKQSCQRTLAHGSDAAIVTYPDAPPRLRSRSKALDRIRFDVGILAGRSRPRAHTTIAPVSTTQCRDIPFPYARDRSKVSWIYIEIATAQFC